MIFSLTKRDGELMMSLLTPCDVIPGDNGLVTLKGEYESKPFIVRMIYDNRLTLAVETIELDDSRLRGSWGEKLYRITLRATTDSPLQDKWILRITR